MKLSPELSTKLEDLQKEFEGSINLNSDGVAEAVYGLGAHLIQANRGAIPIAVVMITNGLALFLAEVKGDKAMALELFDIVATRAKEELES